MAAIPENGSRTHSPIGFETDPNFLAVLNPNYKKTDFDSAIEEHRRRYDAIDIKTFFDNFANKGEYDLVPQNSYDLLYRVMTENPPRETDEEYPQYPFFTDRDDEFSVYGNDFTIHEIVTYIQSNVESGGRDKMLMLVAPSGAGKSTIVDAMKVGLEEYTQRNPLPMVDECIMNEDPRRVVLGVLGAEKANEVREAHGCTLAPTECPHCQEQMEGMDFIKTKVKNLPLAGNRVRGIGKLDPKTTSSFDIGTIDSIILGSNRGILEIAEFCKHDPRLYRSLHDLLRGRELIHGKKRFHLDNVIIGHTTTEEWDMFERPELMQKSLLERMHIIQVPFNLSQQDEVRIYQKFLRQANTTHHEVYTGEEDSSSKHISKRALEALAGIAVTTRYHSEEGTALTPEVKMKLYDRKSVEDFSLDDVANLRQEGRDQYEGMYGFSPELMKSVLKRLVNDTDTCLSPLDVYQELPSILFEKIDLISSTDRQECRDRIDAQRSEYEDELVKTVAKAFRTGYEEAQKTIIQEYWENVDHFVNKEPGRMNVRTGEIEDLDHNFMQQVESAAGYKFNDQEALMQFRREFTMEIGRLSGRGKKGLDIDHTKIPWFAKAVEKLSTGNSEGVAEIIGTIKTKTTTPKQKRRIDEAKQVLIEHHGFCECCVDKAFGYIASSPNLLEQIN